MRRIDPRIRTVVGGFGLTPRESQLVELIAVGYSTEEMAHHLEITESTIRTHLRKIYYDVDVHSRAQLVAMIMAKILRSMPVKKTARRR